MSLILSGSDGVSDIDGTVSTPAIRGTDANTGIFFPAADTIAFTEGGVESMRIDSSGNVGIGTTSVTSGWRFEAKGGLPAIFNADSTASTATYGGVAFYRPTNTASNGNGIQFALNNSSSTQVEYAYIGGLIETNTAGSQNGAIIFAPTAAGSRTERMRILSGGSVGINTSSPTTTLTVDVKSNNYTNGIDISNSNDWGYGSSVNFRAIPTSGGSLTTVAQIQQYYQASNKYGLKFFKYDSSLGEAMNITAEGYLLCPGVYNNTTANAANVYVFGTGDLTRSTSSRKYKTDIVDYSKGLNEVMLLRPVSYKGINDGDKQFAGLIAEEVADKGLVEFVQYAEDGTPDGLAYPHMIALLTKAIQEQQAMIEELKQEVAKLKGN
jgi:hypothetical protein